MPDLLLRVCHATSPSDFTAPTRSVGQEVGSGKFPVCASGKIGKCGRAVRPHVGVPEPKVGAVQGSIRGWPRDWRDAPACSRAVTARQKMRSCQLSRRGRLYKPGATACLRGSAPPSQVPRLFAPGSAPSQKFEDPSPRLGKLPSRSVFQRPVFHQASMHLQVTDPDRALRLFNFARHWESPDLGAAADGSQLAVIGDRG